MDGFDRNLDGYYDVADQLPQYLRERADDCFEAARAAKDAIETVDGHERRAERCRNAFLRAIGGLPDERAPLNARSAGVLEREGYAIELTVFESLPGFHVTGNLYRPTGDGPFPGVLFLCGHAADGKADPAYQRACIGLARAGFAVLSIDPIGQGERVQSYDAATDTVERDRATEHAYLGHQCRVAGTNLARYLVWDGIRALDYLEGRPDVDASRLGVTGNSGGGTQTLYLMLADDRPAAAAPCCAVTARETYMRTGQAQDSEQILDGAVADGLDFDDFLSAFAPKPLLIGCARSDFFPIEGARRSFERTRSVYDRYGRAEHVDLAVADRTHGLTAPLREATVDWFRRHLLDGDAGVPSKRGSDRPPVEDAATLRCTDAGQVHGEFPDETHVVDLTRAVVRERYGDAGSAPAVEDEAAYAEEMAARVRETLELDRQRRPLSPRRIDCEVDDDLGVRFEKVFFFSESRVVVAGILAEATGSPDRVRPTVVLPDRGTADFKAHEERIAHLARRRGLAVAFDPRGVGAVRARDVNTPALNGGDYLDYFGTEYKLGSDALMLDTSLFGMRVFDALRAREYLAWRTERSTAGRSEGRVESGIRANDGSRHRLNDDVTAPDGYGIEGIGVGAMHALYAAVAEPEFRSVRLEDLPDSFHAVATRREYDPDFRLRAAGLVGECDVPQLLPALADRDVSWVGTDPDRFR